MRKLPTIASTDNVMNEMKSAIAASEPVSAFEQSLVMVWCTSEVFSELDEILTFFSCDMHISLTFLKSCYGMGCFCFFRSHDASQCLFKDFLTA